MKKKFLFVGLALLVLVFIAYKILYKKHRDISNEEASFTISVKTLQTEFASNDSLANAKYADKTISIAGMITAIDTEANSLIIDEKLSAILKDKISKDIQLNKQIKVKGRFVGYDNLVEELKMDQVSILE